MAKSGKLVLGTLGRELAAKMMRDKARDLLVALKEALPKEYRCLILLIDQGGTTFVTDAEREEAIRVLRATLEELEAHGRPLRSDLRGHG